MSTSSTVDDRPEVVAHRGDPVGAVENTLDAIRRAVAAGAATVEIDVRLVADGAVVLLHDETTERIWGDPRPARQQSLDELAALRPEGDGHGADGGTHIPSLAEALLTAVPARLLIDVPDAPTALAALDVVRAAGPTVPAPAWCGVLEGLEAVRAQDVSAEIWMTWTAARMPPPELVARLAPFSWNPPHEGVTAESVAAARSLGIETTCWTVDSPQRAQELVELGVRGIISNRAAEVREQLGRAAR